MSFSSGDDGSALDFVMWGPGRAEEFRAGWEGWLEGACLAQLSLKGRTLLVLLSCTQHEMVFGCG